METLADRVRTRREELRLNQTKVAKIAGLKQSDVSKIETGRIQETTKMLGLAKALQCNPDWLATGKGNPDLDAGLAQATAPLRATDPVRWGNPEWPFSRVQVHQFDLLTAEEKAHIEDGILISIKARESPKKRTASESGSEHPLAAHG